MDRLKAVRTRVNAIPSEPDAEIQATDGMNDESELGPDLMPCESGRRVTTESMDVPIEWYLTSAALTSRRQLMEASVWVGRRRG